jgi:hypothetical protein
MDRKWPIIFCDDKAPVCPVNSFLDTVKPKHQVKILRFLGLLEEHGPTLPRPYADLLRDGIHELRIKLSGEHLRMLYFFLLPKVHRVLFRLHQDFGARTAQVHR